MVKQTPGQNLGQETRYRWSLGLDRDSAHQTGARGTVAPQDSALPLCVFPVPASHSRPLRPLPTSRPVQRRRWAGDRAARGVFFRGVSGPGVAPGARVSPRPPLPRAGCPAAQQALPGPAVGRVAGRGSPHLFCWNPAARRSGSCSGEGPPRVWRVIDCCLSRRCLPPSLPSPAGSVVQGRGTG